MRQDGGQVAEYVEIVVGQYSSFKNLKKKLKEILSYEQMMWFHEFLVDSQLD